MTYSTHVSLLVRVAEGVDPQAWIEFHQRYSVLLHGFARRAGLQSSDCEDVVQEVMLALARSMNSFDYRPERGLFRSYLKTMASRVIMRRHRRQSRQPRPWAGHDVTAETDEQSLERVWEEEWRRHHLRQAMARLESEFNEVDRTVFARYAVAGRPAVEVASDLGLSVELVYQVKSRMTRRLHALITEQVQDEG